MGSEICIRDRLSTEPETVNRRIIDLERRRDALADGLLRRDLFVVKSDT